MLLLLLVKQSFSRAVTQKRCVIVKVISCYNSIIRLQTDQNQHNLVLQQRDSMDEHKETAYFHIRRLIAQNNKKLFKK